MNENNHHHHKNNYAKDDKGRKIFKVTKLSDIPRVPRPELLGEPIDGYKWDQLVEKFPELPEMQEYYRSLKPELRDGEPYFCANEQQRRIVTKRILRDLFRGWTKSWPLENSAAFWEAYYALWYAQPDCMNCGCMSLGDIKA